MGFKLPKNNLIDEIFNYSVVIVLVIGVVIVIVLHYGLNLYVFNFWSIF